MADDGRVKVQALMAELGLTRGGGAAGDMDTAIAGISALGGMEKAAMQLSVSLGQSFGEKLGMKNETEVARVLPHPYPVTLRAMLVAMSSGKSGLSVAIDTARGAYLEGAVPGSLFSAAGKVAFEVVDSGGDTTDLRGTCVIPGQKFAYGKGKATLDGVLDRAADLARRF